jgi:DnaJ-class molecular chaperone
MKLINDKDVNNNFYHLNDDNDGNIKDLYYDLSIDTLDYLIGGAKEVAFINKEILQIKIEPFAIETRIEGYGINKGDLIVRFIYEPIKKENWGKLLDADKNEMVRILEKLKNDIKIY